MMNHFVHCAILQKDRDVNEGSLFASETMFVQLQFTLACSALTYVGSSSWSLFRTIQVDTQYKMAYRISRLTNDEK